MRKLHRRDQHTTQVTSVERRTLLVSGPVRTSTFFVHAPASGLRLGRVAAGVQLEGAGSGQQRRRLRPGQSGQQQQKCGERRSLEGPRRGAEDGTSASPGLAGAAHRRICGPSFPVRFQLRTSAANARRRRRCFVFTSLNGVSRRDG